MNQHTIITRKDRAEADADILARLCTAEGISTCSGSRAQVLVMNMAVEAFKRSDAISIIEALTEYTHDANRWDYEGMAESMDFISKEAGKLFDRHYSDAA